MNPFKKVDCVIDCLSVFQCQLDLPIRKLLISLRHCIYDLQQAIILAFSEQSVYIYHLHSHNFIHKLTRTQIYRHRNDKMITGNIFKTNCIYMLISIILKLNQKYHYKQNTCNTIFENIIKAILNNNYMAYGTRRFNDAFTRALQ